MEKNERMARHSVNLMVNQTCRSVVLCVIVLALFVTRSVCRTRFVATLAQGLLLCFGQSGASRFSVQGELIFCVSSIHTKFPSTIYDRNSLDKRRHRHNAWFLLFDRFMHLQVSEAHFAESTCVEGQRFALATEHWTQSWERWSANSCRSSMEEVTTFQSLFRRCNCIVHFLL